MRNLNVQLHPELDYNAFCQCADENSGNFYDFIPQDGSRLVVYLGDLQATGDAPSINVPCLHALVRGLTAGSRGDLAGLARELNGTLYLLGPQDLCAPWFYAQIDPVRHELQYVNAGHESPLLVRKGAVHRLERTGPALGLSARGIHRQETTAIEPFDVLAIFSEAVSDATVLDVVLDHPHAGAAELTRRVLEESGRSTSDRTFAAVRVVGACRRPLLEDCAEESLAMCAA
jgi:sigma-B regulation protein RsbU (phosphoserine phosphatase)